MHWVRKVLIHVGLVATVCVKGQVFGQVGRKVLIGR